MNTGDAMNDVRKGLLSFPAFPVVLASMEHNGIRNIITLGMVHVFSFKPPLIGIGIAPARYSYRLIKESGEFVVGIPDKEIIEAVQYCGTRSGRDVDKFTETKLTPIKGNAVKAPLIKECPVNFECIVVEEVEAGDHTWFIGEVKEVHVDGIYNKENSLIYWDMEYRVVGGVVERRT
jgi:flavin reductase (DIM6/NTAB) family NADH-FMN oxidoreductase RutF